jgi:cellulose biosynthesis protein BcsQ
MNRTTPSQDAPLHEVITFYSYKGGTGRTMALANAACLLASGKEGSLRVLAIDWDLEAPGLHYYLQPSGREAKEMSSRGVVEYFTRVQAFLKETNLDPAKDQDQDQDVDAQRVLSEIPWASFCHATRFANIDFMPAGRIDTSYQSRLAKLDWHHIYQLSPGLFRCFARQLATDYDVVLVDSRTGMNDISGICTSLLPDKLVVVFTPNRQSLTGIENLVKTSVEYRQASRDLRPLMVYPLPSRIDAERDELRQLWRYGDTKRGIEGYQPQFERLFQHAYSLEACELSTYCNEVQVQHSPDYSYGEYVAAIHANEGDRFSIVRSYQALLRWI